MDRLSQDLVDLYDFFQNAPIGMHLVGPDGIIRRANRAELTMLGYESEPDSYLGRHIAEFHADQDVIEDILETLLGGSPIVGRPAELVHRNGSRVPVVIHSSPRMSGSDFVNTRCVTYPDPIGGQQEVTISLPDSRIRDRVSALEDRERAALYDELDDFFENGPVALHIVGPDGRIIRANRAELENMGYADDPAAYIGHHIAEFHADQHVIEDMLTTLVRGDRLTHHRARLVRRDGTQLLVFIYSSPRLEHDAFINTRCFTFPAAIEAASETLRFDWPRNESDESFLTGASSGNRREQHSGRTAALRYLSGRKRLEESLGLLARLTEILGASADSRSTLPAVAALMVPFMADSCSVLILHEPGVLVQVATAHAKQLREAGLERCLSEMMARRRAQAIVGTAGTVCLDLKDSGAETAGLDALRELGVGFLLQVPLAAYGTEAGKLLLLRAEKNRSGPFGAADIALAEELGRRIALALHIETLRRQLDERAVGRA